MYVLHYIFLPRINHAIDSFKTGWNNHPLQTERNWSPIRLWTNGMIDMRNSQVPHIAELQENMLREDEIHWYGIDWNGPIPHNDEISGWVELEDLDSPLNDIEEEHLRNIDTLSNSSSFGIDLFIRAVNEFNYEQYVL